MQLISELARDSRAQHPHRDTADPRRAASVEADVTQAVSGDFLEREQRRRPLDPEDELVRADVRNLCVPASATELPQQPVTAPRGVNELLAVEPTENSFRRDPAVFVELD